MGAKPGTLQFSQRGESKSNCNTGTGRASRALNLLLTLLLIKLGAISDPRKSCITRTPLILFLLWLFKCYYYFLNSRGIHRAASPDPHSTGSYPRSLSHLLQPQKSKMKPQTHFSGKEHHVVPCFLLKSECFV